MTPSIIILFELELSDVKLTKINNKSCTVILNNESVFITRLNYNLLLKGEKLPYKVVDREYKGMNMKWISVAKFNIF